MTNARRIFAKDLLSILRDSQQQISALVAAISAYAIVQSGGVDALFLHLGKFSTWAATAITATPIWILINLVRAPFKASIEEGAKGTWFGNKFVYSQKELLGTVEWRPEDNGSAKLITVKHPQRDSLAYVELEFYPKIDRIRAAVVWVWNQRLPPQMMHSPQDSGSSGVRINKGRLWVIAESQPATVPVIIRVYCHCFVIGKGGVND